MTDKKTKVTAKIVIKGEVYQLSTFGEKFSDGSRRATLRLVKELKSNG